jgi:hypothetical protein
MVLFALKNGCKMLCCFVQKQLQNTKYSVAQFYKRSEPNSSLGAVCRCVNYSIITENVSDALIPGSSIFVALPPFIKVQSA